MPCAFSSVPPSWRLGDGIGCLASNQRALHQAVRKLVGRPVGFENVGDFVPDAGDPPQLMRLIELADVRIGDVLRSPPRIGIEAACPPQRFTALEHAVARIDIIFFVPRKVAAVPTRHRRCGQLAIGADQHALHHEILEMQAHMLLDRMAGRQCRCDLGIDIVPASSHLAAQVAFEWLEVLVERFRPDAHFGHMTLHADFSRASIVFVQHF
jgi:hypothetical protein